MKTCASCCWKRGHVIILLIIYWKANDFQPHKQENYMSVNIERTLLKFDWFSLILLKFYNFRNYSLQLTNIMNL